MTEAEIAQGVEQQINYWISMIGSKEKLEEYRKMSMTQIRQSLRDDFKNSQLAQRMRDKLVEDIKVSPAEVRQYFKEMPEDSIPFVPTEVEVQTPLEKCTQTIVKDNSVVIVPILRAGLGMVDGVLSLVPAAKVGHIGMYRDPDTHEPVDYYCKLPPDIPEREVIVLDPMLATGGSASDAITMVKKRGATNVLLMCLVAAPEGVKKVQEVHPDVDIYTASLDEKLNEHCYILPGLGDAGDRLFGTK